MAAMTASDIRRAIDRVSVYAADVSGDRTEAAQIVAGLRSLSRVALFDLLAAAGLAGVRPRDSRAAMLKRLRDRLTARVRARERAEV